MKKKIWIPISLLLAAVLAFLLIRGVSIQSVDEYYQSHPQEIPAQSETVTLSIRCDTIFDNYDLLDPTLRSKEYLPSDGVILPETRFVLEEGDTVFSVLSRAVRQEKIQMEYTGIDSSPTGTVYIQGIHYLYEFSCGPLSGWMYRVNGEFPNLGCSDYPVQNGDRIEWVYTCDLGHDVGNDFEEP